MEKYLYNTVFIRSYKSGNGDAVRLKISNMRVVRNAGLELDKPPKPGTVNDKKLDESISRARSKIFELGYCNQWQWFFTGTLAPDKYDRTNLEQFHKDLGRWLNNYKRKGCNIQYLLIPELHQDGKSWHIHGLLNGLPVEHLQRFQVGDKMGKALADKVRQGDVVYNWSAYADKFGFCDLEPVKNHEAVCKYITKYCTEELGRCVTEVGAHLYYRSRGLRTGELIKKGAAREGTAPLYADGYASDYCTTVWREVRDSADVDTVIRTYIDT